MNVGTRAFELSPFGSLSWSAPVFDLPLRISANAFAESDRFTQSRGADLDKLGGSARLQYVDAGDDQAFSPYIAYAPRFDFLPTFSQEIATRQDLNVGFNKRFNFGADLQRLPPGGDTSAATVWALGLTLFGQRRWRDPAPGSYAVFIIPSVSYVISPQWNASFALEVIGRWFDPNAAGFARRDIEAEPIATLEYVIARRPVRRAPNGGSVRPPGARPSGRLCPQRLQPAGARLCAMDGERRHQDRLALLTGAGTPPAAGGVPDKRGEEREKQNVRHA